MRRRRCRSAREPRGSAELDAKVDWLTAASSTNRPPRSGAASTRCAIEAMTFDQAIATTESQIALLAQ
jgi:hypothetical protein